MDTSKWKWFRYDEIFDIKSFRGDTLQDLMEGDIPYISATEDNNGINGYIDSDIFCEGNKITVSRNGSVGVAFYQPQNFYPSPDDVRIFALKNYLLTPYIALFLCVLIEKERYRYTYGRKFGTGRMKASLIKLPVTAEGTPDWQYMENFVKDQIIPQLPKKAQKVWLKKFDITPQIDEMKLQIQNWKWFNVGKLFKLEKCKCPNATELLEDGDEIAYIGAKKSDNGVMQIVKRVDDLVTQGNCLVFIGDGQGSVGYCIYQPNDFIGSTTLIAGYNENINPYIAMFLIAVLDKERYRYSFGRKYKKEIIESSKILLPAIKNKKGKDEPDWQFMEDYIKSLPYSRNLEPSKPDEVVDELVEMKKEMIKMRRAMEAQQPGSITNYGTVNIYEK